MQHPRNRKTVAGPLALASLCLLWMGLGTGRALAQAQDSAGANVARVSFVQGSVQLLAGQGSDFQQAVMNMPVVDGSRLQAGGDGQAEVEFGDQQAARAFVAPAWFGEDVTENDAYKNQRLAVEGLPGRS